MIGGVDNDAQEQATLAALMAGSGDPANVDDVVRFWLGTTTWGDSFQVLAAGRDVLVSQAGLDAVLKIADEDERSVHAAIIQAIAGGFDDEFVGLLVANREAAREIAVQALRNGHDPVVRVVLALNSPLGASDEGAALFLANAIAQGDDEAVRLSEMAAASDAQGSQRVAAQLEALAADGLASGEQLQEVLAALRSG